MEYIDNIFNIINLRDVIDIGVIAILTYNSLKLMRGTRAEQLAKGMLVVLMLTKVSEWGRMYTLNWLLEKIMTWGIVVVLIVFQQEIRRGLELLGRTSSIRNRGNIISETPKAVKEVVEAVGSLSRQKIGALIVFERQTGLNDFVETGTEVDGFVSSGLLINIFIPNTPLHDGAVIIKNERVVAAACFLPLSDSNSISKELGTRHRAGIGVTENSDCLCVIVSEETGSISIAEKGVISRYLDLPTLENILSGIYTSKIDETDSLLNIWRKKDEDENKE